MHDVRTTGDTIWNLLAVVGIFSIGDHVLTRWPQMTFTVILVVAVTFLVWYFWRFFFKPLRAAKKGEHFEPRQVDKDFDRQAWEKIRSKGHGRFVLRCVLTRGIPFGVFMVIGSVFFARSSELSARHLADFCIAVFAFGYLGAEMDWRRHESEFLQTAP